MIMIKGRIKIGTDGNLFARAASVTIPAPCQPNPTPMPS